MFLQVLSNSVAKALQLTGGPEMQETAQFVDIFNKFFDCMNVSSLSAGKLKRWAFKSLYRSARDFRLKVCVNYNINVKVFSFASLPIVA